MANRRVEYTGPEVFEGEGADRTLRAGSALPLPEGMSVPDSWPVISVDAGLAARMVEKPGSQWRYWTEAARPPSKKED